MALVVVMWDGLPTGPASAAFVFDAAVLVALLVMHWPAQDLIGARARGVGGSYSPGQITGGA